MVMSLLVVFGGLGPLLPLCGVISEILVDTLEHLIVTGASFDQLKHFSPVTESHSKFQSKILPLDVFEDLFSLIILLEEACNFGFLFDLFFHLGYVVHKLNSIVVFILDHRPFSE